MSECTHDCSTCKLDCSSKKQDFHEQPHELSKIKKVIGIVSGKGGVGKSIVTSMLATLTNRNGFSTAILDADITGPSIPKAFGIKDKATGDGNSIFPVKTVKGIEVMSVNLLLENDSDPVVWRGPVVAGVVKQFWQDVIWNDVDFMFVDMPPGTGDVPLTVFQTIKLDGIIIVASPQELVSMIVEKAVKMAKMMDIKILGVIENMGYVECPDCGKQIKLYGESHIDEVANQYDIPVLAKLPIVPELANQVDSGLIELFEGDWLNDCANKVIALLNE